MTDKKQIAFDKALEYFKAGFNCAQSVIKAVSDAEEQSVPDEMIQAAAGFTGGIGFSGEICGSINGGVLVIGVLLSRKGVKAKAIPKASARFMRWFTKEYGVSNCEDLRNGKAFRHTREQCGLNTANTARKVVEIIEGY